MPNHPTREREDDDFDLLGSPQIDEQDPEDDRALLSSDDPPERNLFDELDLAEDLDLDDLSAMEGPDA